MRRMRDLTVAWRERQIDRKVGRRRPGLRRRALIPHLYVQVYAEHPLVTAMRKGFLP
jgi:hypothetical protein